MAPQGKPVTAQDLRERSFTLWQEAGSPPGGADQFYHQARAELGEPEPVTDDDVDEAIDASFPASDPVNRT